MANTAATAPVSASPTAPTAPVQSAPPVPAQAPNQSAEGAGSGDGKGAAPQKFSVNGQEYSVAEIQAAMEAAAQQQATLSEIAKRESAMGKLKDKAQLMAALKELGHDPLELSTEWLLADEAQSKLTPAEREAQETKAELARYKEQEAKAKAEAEAKRGKEMADALIAQKEQGIMQAMDDAGLPADTDTVRSIIQRIEDYAKAGWEISPKEAVDLSTVEHRYRINKQIGGLTTKQLRTLIPKSTLDALFKEFQAEVAAAAKKNDVEAPSRAPKNSGSPQSKQSSMKTFFDGM